MTGPMNGQRNYRAGLSAEDGVAAIYLDRGARTLARRWRGTGGEIDLVLEQDGKIVFVEVKKSRDIARAAARISQAQRCRIETAAQEFLAGLATGLDTDCRFDVALVDAAGRVEIIENAFM